MKKIFYTFSLLLFTYVLFISSQKANSSYDPLFFTPQTILLDTIELCEQFSASTFPPTGWDWIWAGTSHWRRATQSGFGLGTGSAEYEFWYAVTGYNQNLISAIFPITTSTGSILSIDMAYMPFGSPYRQDSLIIFASSNGGQTYFRIYALGPLQLKTVEDNGQEYYPAPQDWVKRTYSIDAGINRLNFFAKSNFGNNLFLDSICIIRTPVGVEQNTNSIPLAYSLFQNYPNPFNPKTIINYGLPKSGEIRIKIFDISGKEIATLVNEYKNAGNYKIEFDGSDLPSGVYFYKIEAGSFNETKKMLLVK